MTYDPHGGSVTYDIVFVPRPSGASLEQAVEAVDNLGVSDAERDRWFTRLVPAAREVLGDVAVDEAARVVEHAATGIRAEVAAGGVVIRVPYEGEVDPMLVMTLTHALAADLERATGLVGWDTSLGEPVSPRDVPPPRAPAGRSDSGEDREDAGGGRGGGGSRGGGGEGGSGAARDAFVVPAVPADGVPAGSTRRRRRPWWRFWARGWGS